MIKRLRHAALVVSDMEEALPFYRDKMGFKVTMDFTISGEHWDKMFLCPDVKIRIVYFDVDIELAQFIHPTDGRPYDMRPWDIGSTLFIFEVDDLEKTYGELVSRGVEFYAPPIIDEVPGKGTAPVAHIKGPDGVRLSILQLKKD